MLATDILASTAFGGFHRVNSLTIMLSRLPVAGGRVGRISLPAASAVTARRGTGHQRKQDYSSGSSLRRRLGSPARCFFFFRVLKHLKRGGVIFFGTLMMVEARTELPATMGGTAACKSHSLTWRSASGCCGAHLSSC